MGRCADAILADNPHVLRVFIYADSNARRNRVETVYHRPFLFGIKKAMAAFDLLCSKEGRAASRFFLEVEKIDHELLDPCSPYDGELAFFAVSKTCRGMGIGKALFQKAMEYMRSQSIGSFYLFTDTSCNCGFYEHQGMQRKAGQMYSMKMGELTENFEFFLYDYHFNM